MDFNRPCGCKGRRSCLICEKEYEITPNLFISEEKKKNGYVYCHSCQKVWSGWDCLSDICPNHSGKSFNVSGIYVLPDFITSEEKKRLLEGMNKENWDLSQSGRRKQNYGPKCNFKKNKIQLGNFKGFPKFSKFIHDKLKNVPILKDYQVIEQCSLEYNPERGASIDPHIDDCWIWGERIVTVNVLGDTFLTLSRYNGDINKYNLNQVETYPRVLDSNGHLVDSDDRKPFCVNCDEICDMTLRIFMPERSLIVLYGSARYEWEHYVLRKDIQSLRVCLAYREFTPPYLAGGEKENIGAEILEMSKRFF